MEIDEHFSMMQTDDNKCQITYNITERYLHMKDFSHTNFSLKAHECL